MKVLVDTSIWSLALRRAVVPEAYQPYISELNELIQDLRVAMIGPIRQELLSGIPISAQFDILREKLQAFEDIPISMTDYERAAEFFNQCRQAGVQGSHIDFLICSVSAGADLPIFTADKDFVLYARHLPITLHKLRER